MFRPRPNLPRRRLPELVPALAVFAMVMASGLLGLQAAEPAMKSYEVEGVRLEIPADWEVVEEESTVFSAREPRQGAADRFSENIRLSMGEVPASTTLESVLTAVSVNASAEYDVVGSGDLRGGAYPMVWLATVPKKSAGDGFREVLVSYYYVNGTRRYVLNSMTAIENYEIVRPLFEKIARSVALPGGDIPPAPSVDPKLRKAHEGGAMIGNWTFKAMLAAIIVFGGAAVIRRFTRRRPTYPEI